MPSSKNKRLDALLDALYARINYERQSEASADDFKLNNMFELLRRLDNPHMQFPVIHVAGTKGKGSVATMVNQILSAAGHKTGIYTSPHLETIRQRIGIGNQMISPTELADTLEQLEPIAQQLDRESHSADQSPLTFFEMITAAAFLFFSNQNTDVVVLEVGMGGRLDSTNVCQPVVSVITNISLDHTQQLGSTLAKIASEKAGIIKPGVPVVSGVEATEAANVVSDIASSMQTKLVSLNREFEIYSENEETFGIRGDLGNGSFDVRKLQLGMTGEHQKTNAAMAVVVALLLRQQGWQISDSHIRDGLKQAHLAGRLEVVCNRPTIILDIAHNLASVKALVTELQRHRIGTTVRRKSLIVAISQEKDSQGMLSLLLSEFDRVYITKYQSNPRGIKLETLYAEANQIVESSCKPPELIKTETPEIAWEQIACDLTDADLVCIAGSAFLVAELRPLCMNLRPENF